GDARVVYGSGLEIRASISGPPVDGVELVLQTADDSAAGSPRGAKGTTEIVPMFPESEGRWRASVANVTRSMTYLLRARSARSRKFAVEVITVPQIEEVHFRIIAPAYTRQTAYEG